MDFITANCGKPAKEMDLKVLEESPQGPPVQVVYVREKSEFISLDEGRKYQQQVDQSGGRYEGGQHQYWGRGPAT